MLNRKILAISLALALGLSAFFPPQAVLAQSAPGIPTAGSSAQSTTKLINLHCTGNVAVDGSSTVAGGSVITTTGSSNQQIAKGRVFHVSCNGSGVAGILTVSVTYTYTICPGRAGTITALSAGCLTKPSGASEVSVTVYKNDTSHAMCSAYDLNGGTSGASAPIAITGNATLAATDVIVVQVTTGSSIGSCVGAGVSAEMLTTDY